MSLFIGLLVSISVGAEPLLEGQVRLESGEPVANAQVRLFDLTNLHQSVGTTDETGHFALSLPASSPGSALPQGFALGQNYPNPFNPSTIIPYQIPTATRVRLEVFNLLGQRLATLVDREQAAGAHTATWTATDETGRAVGAGVYIYRLVSGGATVSRRMVLIDGQAGTPAAGAASVLPGVSGDEASQQAYGLVVAGPGIAPYVVRDLRVEAGMAPVEVVVEAHPAGKALDDDCAFCDLFDLFDTQQEEAEQAEPDSTSNNATSGPDLIIQSPSVSDNTLTPGQMFTLKATVQNQGDQPAAATTLRYYRSNNATITASDTQVSTDAVGELTASATHADSLALTAPTEALTYFYGACVDPVADESNTDNNCSTAVRTTVSGTGETAPEEAGTSDEQEKEEEEVAEGEVVRSGQAPIDYPDRWMDDLPEHDVFRIELVYLDDFPQWQKDEMRWAADLWELAFTRELPDYDVAEHDREWLSEYLSSQSVSGQPVRVPNVIDDVLVYVIKIPDDDPYGRKGRASTLLVRPHEDPGSCRPAYIGGREDLTVDPHGSCMGPTAMGIVYIVDAENNERYGVDPYSEDWVVMSVDYTFAHEIGHVLGIGSTWLQYVYEASETGETYYEKEQHFPDPYKHYYLNAPHVKAVFAEMNDLEVQREIMQSEGVYPDEDIEYAMSLGPWPTELVPMELYVTGSGPLQHWPQFPLGNSVMGIGLITEPRISKADLGILADIGYDVGETPTKPIPFWRYGVYNHS